MSTLREQLTAPDTKPAAVADLSSLIDSQVAGMSGFTGVAAKAAVAAAKKKDAQIVTRASGAYLGTLADALEPFWRQFQAGADGDFGAFLAQRRDKVGEALLSAADSQAGGGKEKAMLDRFRPQVTKVMLDALPQLGAVIQRHAR